MHGRFWVPKNICFYFAFVLIALAVWTGVLFLYYQSSAIAGRFSVDSIPFLDFNRTGNLGQWFLTLMWLGISIFSFMMVWLVLSRFRLHLSVTRTPQEISGASVEEFAHYHGIARFLFWGSLSCFSLAMSADTACGFIPFMCRIIAEYTETEAGGKSDNLLLVISLTAIGFFLCCVFFSAIQDYVKAIRFTRLIVRGAFAATFVLLLSNLFFAFTVPESSCGISKHSAGSAEASAGTARDEDDGEETVYGAPSESDYRTISYEKGAYGTADLERNELTLESVFGMNVSFEKKLELDRPAEEYLHLDKPIEEYLFGRLPGLDLVQARTFLRRGFYGYFLVLLAGSLGLLARVERKEYDDLITKQTILRMQTPVGVPSPGLLKDIWKYYR